MDVALFMQAGIAVLMLAIAKSLIVDDDKRKTT